MSDKSSKYRPNFRYIHFWARQVYTNLCSLLMVKVLQICTTKCCYIAKLSEFHNLLHVVNAIYETGLVMCLYLFPHSYCRCGGVYSVDSIRPSPTLLDLSFHLLPTGRRCFIFDCPIHCQRTWTMHACNPTAVCIGHNAEETGRQ